MNIHWIYRAYYKVSKTIYYIHVYECQVPCQELEIQKLAGPSSCLQEAILWWQEWSQQDNDGPGGKYYNVGVCARGGNVLSYHKGIPEGPTNEKLHGEEFLGCFCVEFCLKRGRVIVYAKS